MENDISNRKRLLQAIPKDRALIVAKALEKHGLADDDPLILLCIEILEGEARHIQDEFKRHHPILKEIYREHTWHKILTSRLMTFVIGPLVAGAIFFTFMAFARKSENQALQKIVDDPKGFALAMTDGAEAIKKTRAEINSTRAMATLLNIPEAVVGSKDGQIVVQFPKSKAEVTEGKERITIKLFRDPSLVNEDLLAMPPKE